MNNYIFARKYRKPLTKNFVWGLVLSYLSIIFVMLLPQITQLFIDSVFTFNDAPTSSLGILWLNFISLFGNLTTTQIVLILITSFMICALLKNICTLLATQNFFKVASNACGDLRKSSFHKLGFMQNINKNEIFFNLTSDIDDFYNYQYYIHPKALTLPILIAIATILCFMIDYKITLCFIGFLPLIIFLGIKQNKKSLENFKNARQKLSKMASNSEEIVSNIREIKIFGNEAWAEEKYSRANHKHHEVIKNANLYINKNNLMLDLIRVVGITIAIILSAVACFSGKMSIGYFVLIASYAFTIFNTAIILVNNYFDFGIANAGITRLNNLVNQPNTEQNKPDLKESRPTITFNNVEIILKDKTLFSNLNLNLEYGNHYAIKIAQGAGKTALARILLDYASPSNGEILVNNKPWSSFNPPSKRKMFSYIPQEPVIFEGSIEQNIVMFEEANSRRLAKVIKAVGLQSLSSTHPENLNYFLYENGSNITTQDKQRICIARALYHNAPILLIDNAFNKFKPAETEKLLQSISKFYNNKTIIFLTNKKSIAEFKTITIKNNISNK